MYNQHRFLINNKLVPEWISLGQIGDYSHNFGKILGGLPAVLESGIVREQIPGFAYLNLEADFSMFISS